MNTTPVPEDMDHPAIFHNHHISFSTDDFNEYYKICEIIKEALPKKESKIAFAFRTSSHLKSGLSFGTALEALKAGCAVRLPHWSEDVAIRLQRPDEGSKMTHPYLYVESRYGNVPWKETFVELLSENWMLAYDPEGNQLWFD